MNKKSLYQLYDEHTGKVSDKWSLYLNEYDRLFSNYREKPIHLLEIGIQNGGSLEIWSKYFNNASALIGCDINPDCARLSYEDARIDVIVGDANADEVREHVFQCAPQFDIIIDDGSHLSSDIIKSFALYFPHLIEGGIFIAEDLHCSYWGQFEGGLFDPYSSISFFKRLADVINHEHWGIPKSRADILHGISTKYGCEIDAETLSQVHSVEFINSMCVVRKASAASNGLGHRVIAGKIELVVANLKDRVREPDPILDQSNNPWTSREIPPDEEIQRTELSLAITQQQIAKLNEAVDERDGQIAKLNQAVDERDGQIAKLKLQIEEFLSSTSWRITKSLRWIKRVVNRTQQHLQLLTMGRIARYVFRKLNLSTEVKNTIKDVVYQYAGGLFKKQASYRVWKAMRRVEQTMSDGRQRGILTLPFNMALELPLGEKKY